MSGYSKLVLDEEPTVRYMHRYNSYWFCCQKDSWQEKIKSLDRLDSLRLPKRKALVCSAALPHSRVLRLSFNTLEEGYTNLEPDGRCSHGAIKFSKEPGVLI
jgi:hypothetical protein